MPGTLPPSPGAAQMFPRDRSDGWRHPMNDNGTMDKIGGKAKEVAGDVTGKNDLKAEGIMNQVAGKAKEMFEGAKDLAADAGEAIADKASDIKDAVTGKAGDISVDVKDAAEHMRDTIGEKAEHVKEDAEDLVDHKLHHKADDCPADTCGAAGHTAAPKQ